ncbi:hypothetical protein DFH09DRAFT_1427764 [Mycena vulgaris]|nr:hypothetical protein DFH09DRAFT_1427764 [Mycena vulgaris]
MNLDFLALALSTTILPRIPGRIPLLDPSFATNHSSGLLDSIDLIDVRAPRRSGPRYTSASSALASAAPRLLPRGALPLRRRPPRDTHCSPPLCTLAAPADRAGAHPASIYIVLDATMVGISDAPDSGTESNAELKVRHPTFPLSSHANVGRVTFVLSLHPPHSRLPRTSAALALDPRQVADEGSRASLAPPTHHHAAPYCRQPPTQHIDFPRTRHFPPLPRSKIMKILLRARPIP